MKKGIIIYVAILALCLQNVNAQSWKNILSGASKVLKEKVETAVLGPADIKGNWSYSKPAIKLQSSNTLANIGADVVTDQLSEKISNYYSKVGIKPGSFLIYFSEDGTVSTSVRGKKISGTYTLSEDGKTLSIGYKSLGKTFSLPVSLSSDQLSILLGGDKLMDFLQVIMQKLPAGDAVSTIQSIVNNYDSIYIGFTFTKSTDAESGATN